MRWSLSAVAVVVGVLSLHAADSWTVWIRDGLIQPGDVVQVEVAAPDGVASVTAHWNDRQVRFARGGSGRWQAMLGIDVAATAGPVTLSLSGARPPLSPLVHTHAFAVAPKQWRTRRITVNPKFVTPPKSALPRIERETKRLNQIFSASIGERLWTAGAVRPVEGVAVSGFGVRSVLNGQPRGPHNGLDLAAVTGAPVYAPTPGLVVAAEEFYYSGNTVILDHGQGMFSTMAHLSAIEVKEGQRVEKGALLGKVGATGRVTGPHLHWAVRLHGARVDPLSLLDALAGAATPAPAAR
jgi:murein DD-endopeptidase MepM/ murein hydrolase activator NlpD